MQKLLLVEDDNNLREIYEARLAAEGYTIVSAKDGEEALAVAKAEKPDLVISDVMMPKISGFEMLDILRNTDGLKSVRVIMLTALGQSEDQQRANKLGADRYLVKSQVTLEDIVKTVHDLLNDSEGPSPVPAPAPPAATPPAEPVTPPSEPASPPPAAPVPPAPVPAPTPAPEPVTETPPVPEEPVQVSSVSAQEDPEKVQAANSSGSEAKSTTDESAQIDDQIENFVSGANTEAPPPEAQASPEQVTSEADDKLVSSAIDSLAASPVPAPTPAPEPVSAPVETPEEVVAPPAPAPPAATPPAEPVTPPSEPASPPPAAPVPPAPVPAPTPAPEPVTETPPVPEEPVQVSSVSAQEDPEKVQAANSSGSEAKSTTDESAQIDDQIENFVSGANTEAPPPEAQASPEQVTSEADDKLVSSAIDSLAASPVPAPTPAPEPVSAPVETPEEVVAPPEPAVEAPAKELAEAIVAQKQPAEATSEPEPTANPSMPEAQEEKEPNDNVSVAHKKVITPPADADSNKPSIQSLLALEQAKESGITAPTPQVVTSDESNTPKSEEQDPTSIAI